MAQETSGTRRRTWRQVRVFIAMALAATMVLAACAGDGEDVQVESTGASPAAQGSVPAGESAYGLDQETGQSFGPAAPDFTLTTMAGEPFKLSEHAGQVVVLNFWATWCGPCREEIPDFITLQEELEDEGVRFVGVSLDEEGFEIVRPFAEEFGINYPLVVDADGSVASQYGAIYALPTTFLINRKGQVVAHIPGMLTEDVLRPMLDDLIREGKA